MCLIYQMMVVNAKNKIISITPKAAAASSGPSHAAVCWGEEEEEWGGGGGRVYGEQLTQLCTAANAGKMCFQCMFEWNEDDRCGNRLNNPSIRSFYAPYVKQQKRQTSEGRKSESHVTL